MDQAVRKISVTTKFGPYTVSVGNATTPPSRRMAAASAIRSACGASGSTART